MRQHFLMKEKWFIVVLRLEYFNYQVDQQWLNQKNQAHQSTQVINMNIFHLKKKHLEEDPN